MMEFLRRDEHEKLYLQLYEIFKKKIESEEWPKNSQIPTEDQLCELYNVSRVTVRNAILELVRQGYLRRIQGKGTFVIKKMIPEEYSINIDLKKMVMEFGIFSTNILAKTVMMPTDELDSKLDIPENTHIIYINKLCFLDKEPILLQHTYIPYHICPMAIDEDFEKNTIIDVFEKKCNLTITKIDSYIGIANLNERDKKLLYLEENDHVLLLEQFYYSYENKICYTKTFKKNDRFKLFVEIKLQ